MADRSYSRLDRIIGQLDQALLTVFGPSSPPARPSPANGKPEIEMTSEERELAGRLMRVNHAGEICAQALYEGQAVTARLADVREKMERAAAEENDHRAWTAERLHELGARPSRLNPMFYAGAFAVGAAAGLAGDRWSLGFLAETERQVVRHLEGHLERLPSHDRKSRAILEQMKEDEGRHAATARDSGGAPLPEPVQRLMRLASKAVTETAFWI